MRRVRQSRHVGTINESEFAIAMREMGEPDLDNIPTVYSAVRALMVFGHDLGTASRVFDVSKQSICNASLRVEKTLEEIPGKHRLCPGCGRPMLKSRRGH